MVYGMWGYKGNKSLLEKMEHVGDSNWIITLMDGDSIKEIVGNMDMQLKVSGNFILALNKDIIEVKIDYLEQLDKTMIKLVFNEGEITTWIRGNYESPQIKPVSLESG